MKSLIIRLLAVLFLLMPLSGMAQSKAGGGRQTLMVFGDSLSAAYGMEEEQGWVSLLEARLAEERYDYDVINASVSGETSTGGLARLPAMLDSHEPNLVILELGGNDGLRGLPLDTLKANLQEMVNLIRDSGADILLAGIQIPPNYGPRYTLPFFELFGELAIENELPIVPFLIDGIPQQPELMQNDGIHPRAEAQWMIVENVWPYLEPLLES
ncbi:MAG: arylesterase [Proteobacteria bacterium]|nr:arylesterase [Pseudomonadota bacterium]MDA0929120.1 arylesterase [Pseudomonadota bacterium]